MSTTTAAVAHGAAHEHDHGHGAPQYNRLGLNRMGLWLFFISESMIFIILAITRFALFGSEHPHGLNQMLGLAVTAVLLLSSFTAYRAEVSMATGNRMPFLRNMLATILLGMLFLVGVVGVEWQQAIAEGLRPDNGFGMVLFGMTGMHAFHVLTGIALLSGVFVNGARGGFSPEKHWGVEASVKYWHFVDVVWVFFYPILYLIK